MEYALGHKPPQKKKKARKKECGSCNELVALSKRVCNCGFVFYEKKESSFLEAKKKAHFSVSRKLCGFNPAEDSPLVCLLCYNFSFSILYDTN